MRWALHSFAREPRRNRVLEAAFDYALSQEQLHHRQRNTASSFDHRVLASVASVLLPLSTEAREQTGIRAIDRCPCFPLMSIVLSRPDIPSRHAPTADDNACRGLADCTYRAETASNTTGISTPFCAVSMLAGRSGSWAPWSTIGPGADQLEGLVVALSMPGLHLGT